MSSVVLAQQRSICKVALALPGGASVTRAVLVSCVLVACLKEYCDQAVQRPGVSGWQPSSGVVYLPWLAHAAAKVLTILRSVCRVMLADAGACLRDALGGCCRADSLAWRGTLVRLC
jgi:hypothetical protein